VDDFVKSKGGKAIAGNIHAARGFVPAYSQGERTRSFLKIQDGCDYKCSFCTIPLARGRSRSDELDNIVASARALAGDGVREIVLTGVNIGDYRTGQGQKFIDVVRALDAVEGIDRIRISSIEPNLLSDEIIQFVAGSQRFMPHFHLPLQSGNDEMLLRMRRRYKRAVYEDRVATIKRLMPHACIGVDVITGHPGEGEDHFLDTCHFLERLDVSYLHVFTYSERAHTHALTLPHPVPQQVRNERTLQLRSLGEQKRRSFYAQHAGTRRPILFEEEVSEGSLHGFTDNYIKVTTPYDPLLVNEIRTFQLAAPDARGEMRIEADEVELAHPAIGAAATEG
jgi:threonylcarbamoyladenosine tRNA methylthiotransferase MtaB